MLNVTDTQARFAQCNLVDAINDENGHAVKSDIRKQF